MIAASPEITRSGIVFAAANVFPSFDDHHETEPSRLFLPTENPEAPLRKGEDFEVETADPNTRTRSWT
jgi:hypothetical protein